MSLKFMLDSLEGLDESVAALYTEHDDGKFYLEVDGAVAKGKLDEFRNNNIELLKKLESFKDIDPKKYKEAQDELARIQAEKDKGSVIPKEQVDKLVADRVAEMQSEYEAKLQQAQEANGTMSRQLESLVIDSAVRKAATDTKVLPSAVDDVLLRAKTTFKVVDGTAIPHDSNGNIVYGKDGSSPMGIGEWMGKLAKDASHLFEGSQGSGGGGGGGGRPHQDTSKMSPAQKIAAGLETL